MSIEGGWYEGGSSVILSERRISQVATLSCPQICGDINTREGKKKGEIRGEQM